MLGGVGGREGRRVGMWSPGGGGGGGAGRVGEIVWKQGGGSSGVESSAGLAAALSCIAHELDSETDTQDQLYEHWVWCAFTPTAQLFSPD